MQQVSSTLWVDDLTTFDIDTVAKNMRPEDVAEFDCWGLSLEQAVEVFKAAPRSHAKVALVDNKPVFAWGISKARGGCYGLWGFGTPEAKKIIRPLTRYGKTTWLPGVFATGEVSRIDVHVPLKSSHSWSWLMWLGCKIETRLRYFGAHGEEFLLLAYTVDEAKREYPHVHV